MGKKLIIPPPTEKTKPLVSDLKLSLLSNGHKPHKRVKNLYKIQLNRIRRQVTRS